MWLRGQCRNIRRNTLLNLAPLIRLIRAHSVSPTSTHTKKYTLFSYICETYWVTF